MAGDNSSLKLLRVMGSVVGIGEPLSLALGEVESESGQIPTASVTLHATTPSPELQQAPCGRQRWNHEAPVLDCSIGESDAVSVVH